MTCVRFFAFSVVLFTLGISGCMGHKSNVEIVQPKPLEHETKTFQDSEEPQEPDEITKPTGVITLSKALALATMYNPELKAFSWNVRSAEARQLQASLWPNPEVEVEVENFAGSDELSGFDGAETTIQLNQLIELGDKRGKRTKMASLEKQLAGSDYKAKRLDVFTDVTKAFIEVLAAQQRCKLTKELLRLSEDLLAIVTKRVEAGKDSPLQKTKAAVALSKINIQHQHALKDLDFTRKQLASTWADSNPSFESVAGELNLLSHIPPIERLMELMGQNPDLARLALEIDKSNARLELEKAKAISDITFSGGARIFEETNDNAFVCGISIPIPISDRNQGGIRAAAYELNKAREEQRAGHARIRMELAKAYQALSSAYMEASELDKNLLQGAKNLFRASKAGYRQGKLDYLNVLDAQRTFFEARAQYIDALASYHIAKTDVERLIEGPIDSVDLSRSEE
ncbi:MAG: TolC family protein [Thermodesulfobacteriota bacterium]|nr:TolC family protein [Thermodesulfobacteriota bacterium]